MDEIIAGLFKFWPILVVIVPYWWQENAKAKKRQYQHETIMKDINGLGALMRDLKKTVDTNHIEEILRSGHTLEQIQYIRGELDSLHRYNFQKNGHA